MLMQSDAGGCALSRPTGSVCRVYETSVELTEGGTHVAVMCRSQENVCSINTEPLLDSVSQVCSGSRLQLATDNALRTLMRIFCAKLPYSQSGLSANDRICYSDAWTANDD